MYTPYTPHTTYELISNSNQQYTQNEWPNNAAQLLECLSRRNKHILLNFDDKL